MWRGRVASNDYPDEVCDEFAASQDCASYSKEPH